MSQQHREPGWYAPVILKTKLFCDAGCLNSLFRNPCKSSHVLCQARRFGNL